MPYICETDSSRIRHSRKLSMLFAPSPMFAFDLKKKSIKGFHLEKMSNTLKTLL